MKYQVTFEFELKDKEYCHVGDGRFCPGTAIDSTQWKCFVFNRVLSLQPNGKFGYKIMRCPRCIEKAKEIDE